MHPGEAFLNELQDWRGTADFGLEAISTVMALLGNPHEHVPAIHVAGTNGKGSTSAMIAAILGANGSRVGLASSPHLMRSNERIVVDGIPVSDEVLYEYAISLRSAVERSGCRLSFFEGMVALAFLIFADWELDYAVYEVGLGGRLDATNIVSRPVVSAITSISLDHTHILGNCVEDIAREKAGIVKPGVPIVLGEMPDEAVQEIVRHTDTRQARTYIHTRDYWIDQSGNVQLGCEMVMLPGHWQGTYFARNAAVAAMMAKVLALPKRVIEHGFEGVFWPARLEHISCNDVNWLLDCAHNSEGAHELVEFIKQSNFKQLHLVYSSLDTKAWQSVLNQLIPHVHTFHLVPVESVRAVPQHVIARYLSGIGVSAIVYQSQQAAIERLSKLRPENPIVVCGSIYMVGAFRKCLQVQERPLWKCYPKIDFAQSYSDLRSLR